MILPASGAVTQGFSNDHQAVDIDNVIGTPIYAPEAHKVSAVGQMGSGTSDAGLVVQLGNTTDRAHRLCHLSRAVVRVGDNVAEGQLVGYMGNSGYVIKGKNGDGSHLHWIMWVNGVRVDGRKYVTKTPSAPAGGNEDMIKPGDEAQMRIVSSEVKGWDYNQVHSGSVDAREMSAWKGKDYRKFIWEAWLEGQWYRDLKQKQASFYNTYQSIIGDLSTRPSRAELDEAVKKLGAEAEKVAKAEAKALEQEQKNKDLAKELELERAKKSEDSVLLDEAGNWLSKLFNRLFKKG